MMDRKSILLKISEGSQWGPVEETKNYEVIKENLNYLKDVLILDNIEAEFNNNGKLSGWITTRQENCFSLVCNDVKDRNIQGAFHEVHDFIESYRKLYDKPIDIIERIIIKNLISQIENLFEDKISKSEVFEIDLIHGDKELWNEEYKTQITEVIITLR